jgi:hypothetical protein
LTGEKRVLRLLKVRKTAVVDSIYERVEILLGAVFDADIDHEPFMYADPGPVGRRFSEVLPGGPLTVILKRSPTSFATADRKTAETGRIGGHHYIEFKKSI